MIQAPQQRTLNMNGGPVMFSPSKDMERYLPAKAILESRPDPAKKIPGMPPNMGEFPIYPIYTFVGRASTLSHVYRRSDEAIRDSLENSRWMRNHVGIMEALEQRQRATSLLNWHLESEDPDDMNQVDLVEKMTKILTCTKRFTEWRQNLLHALWYGKYAVQNRYRWRKVAGKQRIVIENWKPISGDKLTFRYDDGLYKYDEEQVGIRVGAGYQTGDLVSNRWTVRSVEKIEATDYGLAYFLDPFERNLLTIHKHMIEDGAYEDPISAGNLHGVGIRSRIYWTWFQMQEVLAWMLEYLERSAFGIEIWYYPLGNDEHLQQIQTAAMERIGGGRNIVFVPRMIGEAGDLSGVERIEPGMAGVGELHSLLKEYYYHQIKRYILGQILTSESDATGLGSGVADLHYNTYSQIVKYDAQNLEETITEEALKPLQHFNFPSSRGVNLRFVIDTESPDAEKKMEGFQRAQEMGLKIKASDIADQIGAELAPDQDEFVQGQQQEQGGGGMFPGFGPGQLGGFQAPQGAPPLKGESTVAPAPSSPARFVKETTTHKSPYTSEEFTVTRYAEFKEEDHPRGGKGTKEGGKFVGKGGAQIEEEHPMASQAKELGKESEVQELLGMEGGEERAKKFLEGIETRRTQETSSFPASHELREFKWPKDESMEAMYDATDRMSKDQKKLVQSYVFNSMVTANGQSFDYKIMNAHLRGEDITQTTAPVEGQSLDLPLDELGMVDIEGIEEAQDKMQSAIALANGLPEGLTTYRGAAMSPKETKSMIDKFRGNIGGTITMAGMLSTSIDPSVAARFSEWQPSGFMFEIQPKNGAYMGRISGTMKEREVIMGHGARFRVVNVQDGVSVSKTSPKDPDNPELYRNKTVIQLQEVA